MTRSGSRWRTYTPFYAPHVEIEDEDFKDFIEELEQETIRNFHL